MLPHVLLAGIGPLGWGEIALIVLLIVLLFGANKIPEFAKSLGRAQREFTKARHELEEEATPPTEDERVRNAAKDLGIAVEGKSTDELRRAIAEKMK